MEILKRKNTKRQKIIILIIAAAVVAGGVFAYLYLAKQPSQTSSAEPTESTEQSAKSSTSTASTSTENNSTTSSNSPTKDVIQYSGENNNNSATANSGGVSVTAVQANSTVIISIVINNLWSEGACSVTITNGSASIIKTANIQPMPSYSTCQGFSIPTSDLGAGTWNIKLTVTHSSQTLTGTAEVVVQ